MIDIYSYDMVPLSDFLAEYKELNANNRFRPVAVGRYGIRTRESIYSKELAQDYSKNKLIYKDTLTVGMGSVQMDIGILTDDITYSVSPAYHTYRINGINCDYLRFCLQARNADMFERYKKRGSRQGKSIDLKAWLHYLIPVYEIDGQLQIVSTLHKIQSIIDDRMQELQKLDDLVKARFVEMFGIPFVNDKHWVTKCIGEVVTEVRYGTSRPAVEGGKYPYLRMNNLTNDGEIDLNNLKYIDIPDDEVEKCIVRKGDVLFNRTNSAELVGKTAMFDLDEEMIIAGYIIRVRLQSCLRPEILSQYMNLKPVKELLHSMAKGAVNQANINAQELQSIEVYIPHIELQREFVAFKKQIDKSKFVVQQALDKAQLLFDSLMQQYFG